jgi:hypothetical protein
VLPTRSGRCVEIPGRLAYASCLAAASNRRMEDWRLVKPWLPLAPHQKATKGKFHTLGFLQSVGSRKLSAIAFSILRCFTFS